MSIAEPQLSESGEQLFTVIERAIETYTDYELLRPGMRAAIQAHESAQAKRHGLMAADRAREAAANHALRLQAVETEKDLLKAAYAAILAEYLKRAIEAEMRMAIMKNPR